MKKSVWWAGSAIALAMVLSPVMVDRAAAAGDEAGPKKAKKEGDGGKKAPEGKGKTALKGEWAIMASVLGLDDAQQAKLREAVEAREQAVKAWEDGDGGRKLKALHEEAKKAKEAGDKDKMKPIAEQMKALQKERDDLDAAQEARIMAVLDDTQKTKWKGFTLYRGTIGKYKKLNLADDQDKQIRDLCTEAAKGMPDSADKKAQGEAMKKLNADIVQKVLTDTQRQDLDKKPEKTDKPAKPEGGEKPKAAKGGEKKKGGEGGAVIVQ